MTISPCVRQLFVIGACLLAAFTTGCAMGYPIILLLQLREDDSTIKLTLDTATWIGSVHGISGILGIFVSAFMQWKGRKTAFMVSCSIITLGWVIVYFATSVSTILISEVFHGCGIYALSTVSYLTISEMTSPKFRNIYIQTYSILNGLAISVSGILSRFLNWRTVSLVVSLPGIIALFLSFSWPESPPWLACQGRFNECEQAFKNLRVMGETSKNELDELIAAQKENLLPEKKKLWSLLLFWNKVKRRDFYLPTVHMFLLLNLTYWSGSAVFVINCLEIMQKVTRADNAIYVSGILFNIAFFLGMSTSNVLTKRFKNKPIILCTSVSTAVCLIGLIVVNLLQSFDILSKESLIGLFFIIAYVVIAAFGMLTVVFTVTSEIMPVKNRGIGGAMYIILNSILYSSSLKISPYLLVYINLWGTLLVFTLNALVCGLLIWRFVPETKNRTLQEIEDFYMHGKFIDTHLKCNDAEPFVESL